MMGLLRPSSAKRSQCSPSVSSMKLSICLKPSFANIRSDAELRAPPRPSPAQAPDSQSRSRRLRAPPRCPARDPNAHAPAQIPMRLFWRRLRRRTGLLFRSHPIFPPGLWTTGSPYRQRTADVNGTTIARLRLCRRELDRRQGRRIRHPSRAQTMPGYPVRSAPEARALLSRAWEIGLLSRVIFDLRRRQYDGSGGLRLLTASDTSPFDPKVLTQAGIHGRIVHENELLHATFLVFIHNKEPRADLRGRKIYYLIRLTVGSGIENPLPIPAVQFK